MVDNHIKCYQMASQYLDAQNKFFVKAAQESLLLEVSDAVVSIEKDVVLFSKHSRECESTDCLTFIAKLDFWGMRYCSELSTLFVKIVFFIVNSLQQWDGRHRRRTQLGGIYCFLYLLRRWKNHVHKAFLELDNVGYQLRKEVAL